MDSNLDGCDCSADVIPAATNGQVESVTENWHPCLGALHEERHHMDCNGQLPTCSIIFNSSNNVYLQQSFTVYQMNPSNFTGPPASPDIQEPPVNYSNMSRQSLTTYPHHQSTDGTSFLKS